MANPHRSQGAPSFVSRYNQIDSINELVPCMECKASYTAAEKFDVITYAGASDAENTFNVLVGRAAIPPLSLRMDRTARIPGAATLVLQDATGTFRFDLVPETVIARWDDSTPLFVGLASEPLTSFGVSYFGTIRPLSRGGPIEVSINYNMDHRKVAILPLGQATYPRPLFVSAGGLLE